MANLRATINYLGRTTGRPRFHSQDPRRDNLNLDPRELTIFDGRDAGGRPSIAVEGIELLPHATGIDDFATAEAMDAYRLEIQSFIQALTGALDVRVMGTLVRYGERSPMSVSGTQNRPARFAHVDFSEAEVFRRMSLKTPRRSGRVAMYHVWRALSEPPQDIPLAVCDASSLSDRDLVESDAVRDIGAEPWNCSEGYTVRYNAAHRWFYFSDMKRDEALVFKGYDSDPAQPIRAPHCAFDRPDAGLHAMPRQSVDTRAFCIFGDA